MLCYKVMKVLTLLDISTGQEIRTFKRHSEDDRFVAITPDGRYALSVDIYGDLKLWDISNEKGDMVRWQRVFGVLRSP